MLTGFVQRDLEFVDSKKKKTTTKMRDQPKESDFGVD